MASVELTEAFLGKIAGWEAMKLARAMLASDRVLSSRWSPPTLNGVVQADETSYRAGLVIKDSINIDNLCTCRQSREWGTICAHSVAVALHAIRALQAPPKAAGPGGGAPSIADPPRMTSTRASTPGSASPRAPSSPAPVTSTRSGKRVTRDAAGLACELNLVLPPNFDDAVQRGKITLVVEGVTSRGRLPLHAYIGKGGLHFCDEDLRVLDALEESCGGDTPGMAQFSTAQFASLLPALAGFPRLTLGRSQFLPVSRDPASLPMTVRLETDGELAIALNQAKPALLLGANPEAPEIWVRSAQGLARWSLDPMLSGLARNGSVRLKRIQVPEFLSRVWPSMAGRENIESNFTVDEFSLNPAPPKFVLELTGGLTQLTAVFQCRYGSRIFQAGARAVEEGFWLPDPADIRKFSTRDLVAEHAALERLRRMGFTGPGNQGVWNMAGQNRVLGFFAREFPRLQKVWEVTLESRLEQTASRHLDRVKPEFRVTSSGEQWFDFEVGYVSEGGERFSAADIQQLLLGNGSRRLKNGRYAILDTGAVEELQEVLLDCAPEQTAEAGATGPGGPAARYRMGQVQAAYLDSTLRDQGFSVAGGNDWAQRAAKQSGAIQPQCPPLGSLEPILREYQKQGVAWLQFLRDNEFSGILADEMGLGKTVQVLAYLRANRPAKPGASGDSQPSLVVCPTSLVYNWVAEAHRFVPELRVLALSGPDRAKDFPRMGAHDLIVTSYALLRRDAARYQGVPFDVVVLDEAQHIKNRDTQNAVSVKAIQCRRRLVLTGTPLENSVLDLWSLYDFLMPGYLGTARDFRDRYEIPIVKEKDAGAMSRLNRRIRPFLMRRLKRDVLKELPPKIEQVAWCELSPEQSEVYSQLLSATRREVLEAVGEQGLARSRMLVLTALLRLRQVCCDLRLLGSGGQSSDADGPAVAPSQDATGGKTQVFGELLDEVLDGGHRALVFSQFTSMLKLLKAELEKREIPFCLLDGSTTDRGSVVQRFQNDAGIPVFLISLKAGGVGLNLTAADTVIHYDPWWNPAVEDQATDRAHRLGQTRTVTSYKLITRGTVEEKILKLQARKRQVISATLSGDDALAAALTWEEIQDLFS